MAFRQPAFPPPKNLPFRDFQEQARKHPLVNSTVDDSQEWVLFSPSLAQASPSLSASRTNGLSRLSDFGSFNATANSANNDKEAFGVTDDGDDLDSLDDGLHAFREPPILHNFRRPDQGGGSILPAHDGLGLFAPSSSPVQEQLRTFEKHHSHSRMPHDNRGTVSNLLQQRDISRDVNESVWMDDSRIERIENWRLEQSKLLLEQVKRDVGLSPFPPDAGRSRQESASHQEDHHITPNDKSLGGEDKAKAGEDSDIRKETIWRRLARRVIRDLIGLDDSLLCIIFGESLPVKDSLPNLSEPIQTIHSQRQGDQSRRRPPEGWEDRILHRIARKLNLLIYQLSFHPSTLSEATPATMDYAGMPIGGSNDPERGVSRSRSFEDHEPPSARFTPTLFKKEEDVLANEHASQWGIEDGVGQMPSHLAAEVAYWEQTPDLRTVFSYLGQRLITSKNSRSETLGPANVSTSCTPRSLRRAAIIRQQHPLTTKHCSRRAQDRAGSVSASRRMQQIGAGVSVVSSSLKRTRESCASLSTKKSKRANSGCGSRNYWDVGGSMGSGSVAFEGVGVWGEV